MNQNIITILGISVGDTVFRNSTDIPFQVEKIIIYSSENARFGSLDSSVSLTKDEIRTETERELWRIRKALEVLHLPILTRLDGKQDRPIEIDTALLTTLGDETEGGS